MVFLPSVVDALAIILFSYILWALHDHRKRRGLPYPPGPRGWPIIGNLFDIPKKDSYIKYTEVAKQYGEITSFRVFGKRIVVVNSTKIAKDLFERRGDIYSDRPGLPIREMMGWGTFVPSARYTEAWRQGRRILERGMRPAALVDHRPTQQKQIADLLGRILLRPSEVASHMQAKLIMDMAYGYEVQDIGDELVAASRAMNALSAVTALPGALLINYLPILRHVPEWLPWLSYKPIARQGYDLWQAVANAPIQVVKHNMVHLLYSVCVKSVILISSAIEGGNSTPGRSAGVDTALTAMMNCILALLLHPDAQKKAQAELDGVTGRTRLPNLDDRPRLPFVDAFCKEVLRWWTVTPLAVPHRTTRDDVYEGLFIPSGALVLGNTWGMLRDPLVYPEPDTFKPKRFLNADGSLRDDCALSIVFGYGKRICPGRHQLDTTLFAMVASLLAVFDIKKKLDAEGREVIYPAPFPCDIVPRDEKARALIDAETHAN
ncbi:cytochrome P450 [Gloeopeniophorella convolvens]|nr:cytochrome P450 [Gloeopeniophorella convolvens]